MKRKGKVVTYWSDCPLKLQRTWMIKSMMRTQEWDVHDEIRVKYRWRKMSLQFRMKLIRLDNHGIS